MRKFICSPFGHEVDLDNVETYRYLPQNVKELRKLMFSEIGYSYCYMNFWNNNYNEDQKKRVELLIKNFTENERQNYENIIWYQERVFLFQDEIENMV